MRANSVFKKFLSGEHFRKLAFWRSFYPIRVDGSSKENVGNKNGYVWTGLKVQFYSVYFLCVKLQILKFNRLHKTLLTKI